MVMAPVFRGKNKNDKHWKPCDNNTDLRFFLMSQIHGRHKHWGKLTSTKVNVVCFRWAHCCIYCLCETHVLNRNFNGVLESESETKRCSVVSGSLQPCGLYSPWNSPGQNTGVGSLSLLQGIFPTQGLNPGLLHCRWFLYQLSYHESSQFKPHEIGIIIIPV